MIAPSDLHGLWGFALTPFRDDRVDAGVFRDGVRGLVHGGADVVIACGTLGQGDRMSADERAACVAWASAEAAGAVPVLGVVVADATVRDAAGGILAAGADAALLLPTSADPGAAAAAIGAVREATGGRLPVVLYQRGALVLSPADLVALASDPALIGLKDAHGDLRRFRRLVMALGSRLVWVGASEDLAAAYRIHGADAVSPASMAYAPRYARRTWSALTGGDVEEAIRLLRLVAWPVTDLRLSRPDIDITVVRDLARWFGAPAGDLRPPAQPLLPDETATLKRLARVLRAELGDAA